MIYVNEDFLRLTWLLVPLGENFVEGSTNDGPLELVGPLGPLFGGLLLNTLQEARGKMIFVPSQIKRRHLTLKST